MADQPERITLKTPVSGATIDVVPDSLDRFLAAGYVRADEAPAVNLENPTTKADYLAVAATLGIEIDPKSTKPEIVAAVEAARKAKAEAAAGNDD